MAASRTRLVCQMCDRPAADYRSVDLLVGLAGAPDRERILILAGEDLDKRWALQRQTARLATERETADREVALWRLLDRRRRAAALTLARLGLAGADPAAISRHLSRCTGCGECVDACPSWRAELRSAHALGREAMVEALPEALRSPADCGVCGPCAVECPEGIPLYAIRRALLDRALAPAHAGTGRASREGLSWTT